MTSLQKNTDKLNLLLTNLGVDYSFCIKREESENIHLRLIISNLNPNDFKVNGKIEDILLKEMGSETLTSIYDSNDRRLSFDCIINSPWADKLYNTSPKEI